MLSRIIPRLDIKGPNLVKGIHLEGLRVLGKPQFFARHYNAQGADELLFMDVVASLYGRNNALDIVSRTADEIFIPLTVGGGLRSLDDIQAALRAGADKVSLNTAAIQDPDLIARAAHRFGSSTIVVSVEAILQPDGTYEAFTDNGRERTGLNAVDWAKRVAALGAGELVVTSIDREGTGKGYDVKLVEQIATGVSVPVVACGGAGSVQDVADVLRTGATAASMASLIHYNLMRHQDPTEDGEFAPEINLAHLARPGFSRIQDASLHEMKATLNDLGLRSRPRPSEVV